MSRRLRTKIVSLLGTAVIIMCATQLNAQHLVFVYGHALYASPLDKNFQNGYNSGIGAEAGAGIGWKKTFLVGTIGYTNFFHKSIVEEGDLHFVPIKAGLRQYLFLKNLYIHGDVGLGTIKNKVTSDTRFSGDVGVGIKFVGLEAELDYDGFNRKDPSGYASWIGIKAGFALGL